MRTSEWIQVGFAIILAVAAWIHALSAHPLPARRRWNITLLGLVPLAAVSLARASAHFLPPLYVSILRDFLTVALFLVPYWQTGQFFQKPNHRLEQRLLTFDRWLMPRTATTSGTARTGIGLVLEVAYLFCYPMVPLGLAVFYVIGQREHVASFWLVVLIATYLCYAFTPFVPAYPPRDLAGRQPPPAQVGKARIFNRWILKHGSIHAISFPSAHVASSFAVALVLLRFTPVFGLIFLFIAVWISLGAVVGRYHYALDVLLGAITALLVFLVCFDYLT
ncbi:MAG: phosphatase PAP2 family protein [Acidobacteriaceae bacterium]